MVSWIYIRYILTDFTCNYYEYPFCSNAAISIAQVIGNAGSNNKWKNNKLDGCVDVILKEQVVCVGLSVDG